MYVLVVTKQVVKGLQDAFLSILIESNYVFSWDLKRYFVFQTCLILIYYKILFHYQCSLNKWSKVNF